jgi:hypothetical protein
LPGFVAIGIAVDEFSAQDGRRQFGNMILSRCRGQVFNLLPDPRTRRYRRYAWPEVVWRRWRDRCVSTSHLEFCSAI